MEPIRLGISSCLLGQQVRWDGGHKRNAFLTETLGRFVEWVPVCPEAEAGMGVPREPVSLVVVGETTRMRGLKSGEDWTARMRSHSSRRLRELPDLCGYVFKKGSPSCGVFGVRGLHAAAFQRAFPLVPVEEEGRLSDARLREAFVSRVFALGRLRALTWKPAELVAFHSDHKYQLLAHSQKGYRELGGMVARAGELPRAELRRTYTEKFLETLSVPATPRKHASVMEHVLGHFKKELSGADKREVLSLIEEHRTGQVPRAVPLMLLAHHARKLGEPWLRRQTYFAPFPRQLRLLHRV